MFVRPHVIAELAGVSYATVMRDLERYNWPLKRRPQSKIKYLDLASVELSYGRRFDAQKVFEANQRHTVPAVID